MNTVPCYDRFATQKRLGAALFLLGAGAVLALNLVASAAPPVQQLPRVVITGKSIQPSRVVQLPRVVVIGKRQSIEPAQYALVDPAPADF